MRFRVPKRGRRSSSLVGLVLLFTAFAIMNVAGANAVVAGAGFTTNNPNADGNSSCLNGPPSATPKVNCNLYGSKEFVWTNGGPSAGQNKLSTGTYFFAVLEPGGQGSNENPNDGTSHNLSDDNTAGGLATVGCGTDPPGFTTGCGDTYVNRRFEVGANGKITNYLPDGDPGTPDHGTSSAYDPPLGLMIRLAYFDDTSNPGGVYIMAVCRIDTLASYNSETKTYDAGTTPVTAANCKYDAFKAPRAGPCEENCDNEPFGVVSGLKYYDTNVDGDWDAGEPGIGNWPIDYKNGVSGTLFTQSDGTFSASFPEDTYTFAEKQANSPWMQTGNTVDQSSTTGGATVVLANKIYTVKVLDNSTASGLNFGNVCVGAGGGMTLGFWSNKNGGNILKANGNAILNGVLALNLRKANGDLLGSVNLATFQSFLLSATATNMANMLSAQLAAMKANVLSGKVSGTALIYAPGTTSANAAGFATVDAVMTEANTSLGTFGLTLAGHAERAHQEALKNALDNANNNLNFLQPGPSSCPTPVFPTS
jgi:hypothetical protein